MSKQNISASTIAKKLADQDLKVLYEVLREMKIEKDAQEEDVQEENKPGLKRAAAS